MSEGAEVTDAESKSVREIVSEAFEELRSTFAAFFRAPRALWGINVPYILEGLVYFGILTILGKFCSENVRLTDVLSGLVYGGVTSGITFAMLFFGGISDRLGIRASLALSLGIMALGRLLISISGTISLGHGLGSPMFYLMAVGLLFTVAAYGLYQPSAYAGVKRYSNPRIASVSYAVIYGLMNLGAFCSGFVSSFTRHHFQSLFPPNGLTAVFWTYTALTVIGALTTLFIITRKVDRDAVEKVARETAEMQQGGAGAAEKKEPVETKGAGKINHIPFIACVLAAIVFIFLSINAALGKIHSPFSYQVTVGNVTIYFSLLSVLIFLAVFSFIMSIWEYLRNRPDHPMRDGRFVFFIFILMPVQTLFAHNWLTIPYYLDRAFAGGWVSRYFEIFSNINPVLIFILSPIVAALTARAPIYRMMIIGTFVMALPTFLLAIGPNVGLFLVYVVLMSLGEAIWQPRFLQWIAEIAPEGKTGAYMGIGQFPWFLTKFVTSLYSGYFVAHYCPIPGTGAMKTGLMWLIYSFIALLSPIALIIANRWMAKGMEKKA